MNRLSGTGRLDPFRETKFSGANKNREMFIFPVELTTSRIGNLTRLIYSAICDHTYMYLEMSLFPSIFCTIAVFSLYGEDVVRSFLPDGVFLLCGHGLDF